MGAATLSCPLARSVNLTSGCSRTSVNSPASKTRKHLTPYRSDYRNGGLSAAVSKGQPVLVISSSTRSRQCVASSKKEEKSWAAQTGGREESLLRRVSKALSSTLAAGVILLNSGSTAWAEDGFTVTFPGSNITEVNSVQRTLVEAWGIVRETYVDPSFNHQDWNSKLQDSLATTLSDKSSDAAYAKIKTMLASLGDPFTRIITPKEYENFRINNDGALEGVGLMIASERDTGRLIVMTPLDGGPAQRAGVLPGDELLYIDDQPLSGLDGEMAATRLRGRAGTSVTLTLRRSVDEDGVVGEPQLTQVKLKRETISLSPVYSTVLEHPGLDGHKEKTGYIRLSTFSQNAASDMKRAIEKLESAGVASYILDLRNNPGGLVKAGLDVAQMWLDGDEVLVNTVDRDGDTQPITLVDGHALTQNPLVLLVSSNLAPASLSPVSLDLLDTTASYSTGTWGYTLWHNGIELGIYQVNEGSASASEILAGALHDNGRAVLVGQKTFGKGKIQSVTELEDGSALFVTVAKYLSPSFHQIDQVGIVPDLKCTSEEVDVVEEPLPAPKSLQEEVRNAEEAGRRRLQKDSCILAAEHELDRVVT
ncbi:hypothetical protein R1sor_008376 [Riccia sorocarpa]|uniref:C-terminal processing peptidase n=1 Tax=Riccia sorocarpa TaxID=122646 RepID=A0ABD3HT64_9MARC